MSEEILTSETLDDYVPALLNAAKEMRRGIDGNFAWANLCQGAAEYIVALRDPIVTVPVDAVFKATEPLELGCAKLYVFPDPTWIEIEIRDPESGAGEIQSFDVESARQIRDWLNKVLP